MSAQLEKQASTHASVFDNAGRQLIQSVPPVPPAIDLVGKTALVTGSNVGLGLECARHFLELRASRLIMAVRSFPKGETAAAILRAKIRDSRIEVWQLGLGRTNFERTEAGRCRETTIQVNHPSTALLAILLIPRLKPSTSSPRPGRLSIVSSDSAHRVILEDPGQDGLLDSLDRPHKFQGFPQYAKSKLLVTMFVANLAEVVDPDEVIIKCSNPGSTKGTGFPDDVNSWLVKAIFGLVFGSLGRRVVDAARIYMHSSLVLGKESHGSYTDWFIRPWPAVMYDNFGRRTSEKLWSETMEELRFAGVNEILEGAKHL